MENRISQTWEEQKTEENGCPNIGKTEKRRKNAFPNLGRIKNLKGCISQPLEEQKIPLRTFPTPRTGCFFCFSFIHPLGRAIFVVFHSSNPLDGLFFLFSIHPTPWTGDFSRFSFIRGLGRAVFPVFHSSNPLDERFFSFFIHPTPRTSCFSCFSFIRGLGRAVFPVFRSSEASDGLFFPFFVHPRPRTSISMRGFPPIRLLFGVVNSRVSCRITNRNAAEFTDLIRVCRILGIPRAIRVCIYRI